MKIDKVLIGIIALIIVLLIASFFVSPKDDGVKDDHNEQEEHYDGDDHDNEEEDSSTSTDELLEEEENESTGTATDQNVVLTPLAPTSPSVSYTWKPNPTPQPVVQTEVDQEEDEVLSGLTSARVQYTDNALILIDVRDDHDTPRIRYSNKGADPVAILSKMYGMSRKDVLELTTFTYKELEKEYSELIGDIQEADSYVSSGNTLISVQGESDAYYFWTKDSNVYNSAQKAARYLRKNMFSFWDKFFVD